MKQRKRINDFRRKIIVHRLGGVFREEVWPPTWHLPTKEEQYRVETLNALTTVSTKSLHSHVGALQDAIVNMHISDVFERIKDQMDPYINLEITDDEGLTHIHASCKVVCTTPIDGERHQ